MPTLLEEILHELNFLHGLYATDTFRVYEEAQRAGCRPNVAWDRFREECFQIDVLSLIAKIDARLSEEATRKEVVQCPCCTEFYVKTRENDILCPECNRMQAAFNG